MIAERRGRAKINERLKDQLVRLAKSGELNSTSSCARASEQNHNHKEDLFKRKLPASNISDAG